MRKLSIIFLAMLSISIFATVLIAQRGKTVSEHLFIETDLGTIEIRFFEDKAPKHVEAIKRLVNDGFYDGTLFHSKESDRSLHGTGGPGFVIPAEFNEVSHKRGIVSMARSQSINSAGSQFFICVADSTFLDRQYTVWGEVVNGMATVDKIVAVEKDANDNPLKAVKMNKVYIKSVE